MNKKLKTLLIIGLPLLAAIVINYTNYNNPVLLPVVALLSFYVLLRYKNLIYFLMILAVFIPNYATLGSFRIAGSDALVFLVFVFWLLSALISKQKIKMPKFYAYILLFLMALVASLSAALNIQNSLKEIAQYLFLPLRI